MSLDIERLARMFPNMQLLLRVPLLAILTLPNAETGSLSPLRQLSKAAMSLRILMPDLHTMDHSSCLMKLFCAPSGASALASVEMLLYFLSNNLVEPTEDLDDCFASCIENIPLNNNPLRKFIISNQPSAQAIMHLIYGSVVRVGNAKALAILLEAGLDVMKSVRTAWLLRKSYNLSYSGALTHTALDIAVYMGYSEVIELLLRQETIKSDCASSMKCLYLIPRGRLNIYRILVLSMTTSDAGRKQFLDQFKRAIIRRPSAIQDRELLTLFFDHLWSGVYSPNDVSAVFCIAILHQSEELIYKFLERDADYTTKVVQWKGFEFARNSPVYAAAKSKRYDICEVLLRKAAGKGKTENKHTLRACLNSAVERENLAMIRLFLQYGADLNDNVCEIWHLEKRCEVASTPLSIAAKLNSLKAFELLLANGAVLADDIFHLSVGSQVHVIDRPKRLSGARKAEVAEYLVSIGVLACLSMVQIQTCLDLAIQNHYNIVAQDLYAFLSQGSSRVNKGFVNAWIDVALEANPLLIPEMGWTREMSKQQSLVYARTLFASGDCLAASQFLDNLKPLDAAHRIEFARSASRCFNLVMALDILDDLYDPLVLFLATLASHWKQNSAILLEVLERRRSRTFPVESGVFEKAALAVVVFYENWELLEMLLANGVRHTFVPDISSYMYNWPRFGNDPHLWGINGYPRSAEFFNSDLEKRPQISLVAVALRWSDWSKVSGGIIDHLLKLGFTACDEAIYLAIQLEDLKLVRKVFDHCPIHLQKSTKTHVGLKRMMEDNHRHLDRDCVMSIIDLIYDNANDYFEFYDTVGLQNGLDDHFNCRTVLQYAASIGDVKIVLHLLEKGADVNQPPYERFGATALQAAVIGGYIGMVKLLLDRGAHCDAPGAEEYGRTALEAATEHGRLDIVALLVSRGAKVEGSGQVQYIRAIYFAEHEAHHAVADFLRSRRQWTPLDQRLYELYNSADYCDVNEGLCLDDINVDGDFDLIPWADLVNFPDDDAMDVAW